MKTTDYRLPDGRIVRVDSSAAKDALFIDFTLADGTIVEAMRYPLSQPRKEVK